MILDLDHVIYIDFIMDILYRWCISKLFLMIHLGWLWYLCNTTYRLWMDLCRSLIRWWFALFEGWLGEVVLGGVVKLIGDGNVWMPQCHCVAYSGQHQCQTVLFSCFNYLYIYYCFLSIKRERNKASMKSRYPYLFSD